MAGFGPAFAQAFGAERQRSEDRKDDMFKLMYSDYIHRRDKYDDWQKEQAKQVNKAKALQDAYGQPDGSWPLIYNWINSGLDDSIISKRLAGGKLSVSTPSTPNTQSPDQTPSAPNQETTPSTDGQMVDSGLVKPASATTTPTTSTNPATPPSANAPAVTGQPQPPKQVTQHKGLLSNLFPGFKGLSGNGGQSVDQRNTDYSINKIATMTKQDPNTVRKIMAPGGVSQGTGQMDISGIQYKPGIDDQSIDGMSTKEQLQYNTVPELQILEQQATTQGKPNLAAWAHNKMELTRRYEMEKQVAVHGVPGPQIFAMVKTTPQGNTWIRNVQGKYTFNPDTGQYVPTDLRGNPIDNGGDINAVPVDEKQLEKQQELTQGQTAQAVRAYQGNINRLAGTIRLVNDMNKIVQADPNVLNFGGKLAEVGVSAVRDVVGTVNTLGQVLASNKTLTDEDIKKKTGMTLEQLEKRVDDLMGTAATNTASRAALFEAKKQLAAFQFASTQSQTGRNLSDKDYQRFLSMLQGTTDPRTWQKSIADFINTEAQSLNEQSQQINDSPESKGFTQAYGYNMMPPVASSFDEFVNKSNDPGLKEGYQFVKQYAGQAAQPTYQENTQQTQQQPAQQTPAQAQTFQTPPDLAVKALLADPSKADQFDAKYGPGMAKRYLGNK